ncbi:MAG: hypothetical protein JO314_13095 [Acidobacteria bacterium]|nr:hypothetical protein [Acidobacteriota bacterium]
MKLKLGNALPTPVFCFLAGIALCGIVQNAHAQGPPKFHVGQRVEFDILETGDPARAKWVNATITNIRVVRLSSTQTQTNYEVTVDPQRGRLPQVLEISQRLAEQGMTYSGDASRTIGFIRAAGGGNAGGGGGNGMGNGGGGGVRYDKLHVDRNNTVLADRAVLDCESLYHQPPAKPGPPPTELAKELIRCSAGYEQPSARGADGARTMDITQFTPTGSHRWRYGVDSAFGGAAGSVVYTYRVKFDLKTYYRQHNQLETGVEKIFSCYVDTNIHQWYCGQYQSVNDGQRTMILVKP